MELEEKKITLRKLVASDGKYIREKSFKEEIIDDNGVIQKITPDFATIVFLAINASEDDYEELDMPSKEQIDQLKKENEQFNQEQIELYEKSQKEIDNI